MSQYKKIIDKILTTEGCILNEVFFSTTNPNSAEIEKITFYIYTNHFLLTKNIFADKFDIVCSNGVFKLNNLNEVLEFIDSEIEGHSLQKVISENDYDTFDIISIYSHLSYVLGNRLDLDNWLIELQEQFLNVYEVIEAFCGFYPYEDITNEKNWVIERLNDAEDEVEFLFTNDRHEIFVHTIVLD